MTLRYLTGKDRIHPRPFLSAIPDCATDGCLRSVYADGLCKRCHDVANYKSESAQLHPEPAA